VNSEDQKRAEENPGDFVARREREQALIPLLNALHELDVRINGLNRDMCHCGLVAEVALNALNLGQRREAAYRAGREDAARDALIIRGDLDITTVVAALDRAGFDCPDDALGNASADLLQRLPVWQGSDGRYRPRMPKVDQPGVQPTEEQRAEDQERDEGQG
jgi:hypothetical protein